jgi:diamine N-acetyltransferase
MIIVPGNMNLREVTIQDHEFLVELHNDPDVLKNVTDPTPVTMETHLKWWHEIHQEPREKRLIFEVGGVKVGFTKFYSIDLVNKNCVLGADIHKSHRGYGYAKMMWSLMLNKCFIDWKLHRVSLLTASFNEVGRHIYKNVGFKDEGVGTQLLLRDGKFYDCIYMYMLDEDWYKR